MNIIIQGESSMDINIHRRPSKFYTFLSVIRKDGKDLRETIFYEIFCEMSYEEKGFLEKYFMSCEHYHLQLSWVEFVKQRHKECICYHQSFLVIQDIFIPIYKPNSHSSE